MTSQDIRKTHPALSALRKSGSRSAETLIGYLEHEDDEYRIFLTLDTTRSLSVKKNAVLAISEISDGSGRVALTIEATQEITITLSAKRKINVTELMSEISASGSDCG